MPIVECMLRRAEPVIVPISNEIYTFEPDAKGRLVTNVWRDDHLAMFLASGVSHLYRLVDDAPPPAEAAPPPPPAKEPPPPPPAPPTEEELAARLSEPPSAATAAMVGIGGQAGVYASAEPDGLSRQLDEKPTDAPATAPPPSRSEMFAALKERGVKVPFSPTNAQLTRLYTEHVGA